MSLIPRFAAYAADFEKAYATDDWSVVEPHFAEEAVYVVGSTVLGRDRCEGRAEILAWFKEVLDRFDRRFGSRRLELLDGPKETGDAVWIKGAAIYETEGLPDLVLTLEETVRFENGEIVHLEDAYTQAMEDEAARYLREHGAALGIELPD